MFDPSSLTDIYGTAGMLYGVLIIKLIAGALSFFMCHTVCHLCMKIISKLCYCYVRFLVFLSPYQLLLRLSCDLSHKTVLHSSTWEWTFIVMWQSFGHVNVGLALNESLPFFAGREDTSEPQASTCKLCLVCHLALISALCHSEGKIIEMVALVSTFDIHSSGQKLLKIM